MDLLQNKLRQPRRQYPDPADRTAATLAVEGLLSAIVLNLATAYTPMFAIRLGATDNQVGLISALPQLFALIALIPGALLASCLRDRRRPVEIALLLTGFFYGLVGFSPYIGSIRVWYLIGLVSLANAPAALYNTTWQNYFSDIIPAGQRNSAYTRRTAMTFIASIVVVQLSGVLLGSAQTDQTRILLYQVCYWLTLIISFLQLRFLRQAPSDYSNQADITWRDFGKALQEIIQAKRFLSFGIISLLMHAGWYMAWPLFLLTQVNYLGANEAWQSYVTVPGNLILWLTVRPWSKYIEKHGIRLTLIIGCLGLAVNPLMTMVTAYLPVGWGLPVLIGFNMLNGATFSAFQLTILQCLLEVVPVRNKPLNLSFYTAILLLANAIMPIFGVRLYAWLGSDLRAMTQTMGAASALRFLGAVLFFLRWLRLRQEPDSGIRA